MPFEPLPNTRYPQQRAGITSQLMIGKDIYFYHCGLKQMYRGIIKDIRQVGNKDYVDIVYFNNDDKQQYKHSTTVNNIRKVF